MRLLKAVFTLTGLFVLALIVFAIQFIGIGMYERYVVRGVPFPN